MRYYNAACNQPLPGSNPFELVESLRRKSRTGRKLPVSAYMAYFANQYYDMTQGQQIRTDCPNHFVADLINNQWVMDLQQLSNLTLA